MYRDMFIDKTMGIDNDIWCLRSSVNILNTCPKPDLCKCIVFLC